MLGYVRFIEQTGDRSNTTIRTMCEALENLSALLRHSVLTENATSPLAQDAIQSCRTKHVSNSWPLPEFLRQFGHALYAFALWIEQLWVFIDDQYHLATAKSTLKPVKILNCLILARE
jgi:hypothetical protein